MTSKRDLIASSRKCEECERIRKEFNEAFSKGAMIKAAQIAMEGAKKMIKGGGDEKAG